jgi:hypothetical protein
MASELEEATHAQEDELVRELIHTHLRSALTEVTPEPTPLTVGHVMARIHADAALAGKVEREMLAATRDYQSVDTPLPKDLSLRGVRNLLEQLGLKVGRRFQDIFRDTAIFMRMGRNQGMARMAATRRQQAASKPSTAMLYRMAEASPPPPPTKPTLHEAAGESTYTASEETPSEKPEDRPTGKPDNQHTGPPNGTSTGDPSTGRPDEDTK